MPSPSSSPLPSPSLFFLAALPIFLACTALPLILTVILKNNQLNLSKIIIFTIRTPQPQKHYLCGVIYSLYGIYFVLKRTALMR